MEDTDLGTGRWQHLVILAFSLEEGQTASSVIASALEVFGPDVDPVEDFEGYAVRRLLLALRQRIEAGGAA